MGDKKTVIADLGEEHRQKLVTFFPEYLGAGNENMLSREILEFPRVARGKKEISDTLHQISMCAEEHVDDNDFAKDYLKKLAQLVRGNAKKRKEACALARASATGSLV